jgi:hypothetical protein
MLLMLLALDMMLAMQAKELADQMCSRMQSAGVSESLLPMCHIAGDT